MKLKVNAMDPTYLKLDEEDARLLAGEEGESTTLCESLARLEDCLSQIDNY